MEGILKIKLKPALSDPPRIPTPPRRQVDRAIRERTAPLAFVYRIGSSEGSMVVRVENTNTIARGTRSGNAARNGEHITYNLEPLHYKTRPSTQLEREITLQERGKCARLRIRRKLRVVTT
jgi:hypothetical protein